MRRGRENVLFAEGDLDATLRAHFSKAQAIVDAIPDKKFVSSTDEQLLEEVVEQLVVTPLELLEAETSMRKEETKIDVSGDPLRNMFNRGGGPLYVDGTRVKVLIPFKGDAGLWKLRPNSWRSTFPHANIHVPHGKSEGTVEIIIDIPVDESPEKIKQQYERTLDDIRFYLTNQVSQLQTVKSSLSTQIQAAIHRRRQRMSAHDNISDLLGIPIKADPVVSPANNPKSTPLAEKTAPAARKQPQKEWDVFISHASEDKEAFARPLAKALQDAGIHVWFDEFTLRVGDSLRRSIDKGLAHSRYGVVVISEPFLQKEWPQKELDGLVAREVNGNKVILPVWHNVALETVRSNSPLLADRLATSSQKGLNQVVKDLLDAMGR
jgi:hypothetical protein